MEPYEKEMSTYLTSCKLGEDQMQVDAQLLLVIFRDVLNFSH